MFSKGDTPWRLVAVRRLSIWLAVVFVALTAVYLIVGRSALLDVEEIKVFENDNPVEIVAKFGNEFNLSQNARQRLLEQIQEQIQMDEDD